ncbi:MAG: hypothetical protein ACRCZH_03110, partial [Cetobacterium sp.]
PKEFGGLDLNKFLKQLKNSDVEMVAVIALESGAKFASYILEELQIDLAEDIIYPENSGGEISYDEDMEELVFGEYRYLVIFKEDEYGDGDYIYWYSAYKNLENISKELNLLY